MESSQCAVTRLASLEGLYGGYGRPSAPSPAERTAENYQGRPASLIHTLIAARTEVLPRAPTAAKQTVELHTSRKTMGQRE